MTSNRQSTQMMVDASKVLGSMTIQDGQIIKADGELLNAERMANLIQKMIAVGPVFPPTSSKMQQHNQATANLIDLFTENSSSQSTNEQQGMNSPAAFEQLTILYPDHQFDIVIGEISGGGPLGMVGSGKPQKQVIHVLKRSRILAD